MTPITLALDAMGGDLGLDAHVSGAARFVAERPSVRFLIIGDAKGIARALDAAPDLRARSDIIPADTVVGPDEKPSAALRTGRASSMRRAIDCVAEGRANGVISSGNTGALMAMAKLGLRCLPGIHRPAIASVMPTERGFTTMLDLGANVACDAEMLVQFAILGTVYARVVRGIPHPSVGLLNIGSEDMKGHDGLREAAQILSAIRFPGRYAGFIEGNDIPAGAVDVVVTDGFTGNIALKVAEGVGKLTSHFIKDAFKASPLGWIAGAFAIGPLRAVKKRLDPRLYNGGMFLGLDGVCVKSHGSSDPVGVASALRVAHDLVANNFNARVADEIADVMAQESFVTSTLDSAA